MYVRLKKAKTGVTERQFQCKWMELICYIQIYKFVGMAM